VFTTSLSWLPESAYSRFGYYACRHHGGDRSAAARALLADERPDARATPGAATASEIDPASIAAVLSCPVTPETEESTWPMLDRAALVGPIGAAVDVISPHTEADPAGLLLSLLVGFGNAVGPTPHASVGGTRHPARLFAVLVGDTSKARKGTAWRDGRLVLDSLDDPWARYRIMSGLSSGEGLIAAVADPDESGTNLPPQRRDRRLMVIEEEFARTLTACRRDGSTLSAILRQAYDTGDLAVLTKAPQRATGAHIGLLGHITVEELRAKLTETDMANGLANRMLFVRPALEAAPGGRSPPTARARRTDHKAPRSPRPGEGAGPSRAAVGRGRGTLEGRLRGDGRRRYGRPSRRPVCAA
jgi:hypothetical protein